MKRPYIPAAVRRAGGYLWLARRVVGELHLSANPRRVVEALHPNVRHFKRHERRAIYRYALWEQNKMRGIYQRVMGGRLK